MTLCTQHRTKAAICNAIFIYQELYCHVDNVVMNEIHCLCQIKGDLCDSRKLQLDIELPSKYLNMWLESLDNFNQVSKVLVNTGWNPPGKSCRSRGYYRGSNSSVYNDHSFQCFDTCGLLSLALFVFLSLSLCSVLPMQKEKWQGYQMCMTLLYWLHLSVNHQPSKGVTYQSALSSAFSILCCTAAPSS